LLLKAALTKGKSCYESWQQLKTSIDIDSLDQTSRRIIPLLYQNLSREGIVDPVMEKFKGIYRYTWYSNRLLFYSLTPILQTLHENHIDILLLKGAALILVYYKDYGLRPMHDFDILVPFDKARHAMKIMLDNGWAAKSDIPRVVSDTYLQYVHGTVFENDSGFDCDLHWNLFEDSYLSPEDVNFFDKAIPFRFHDIPAYVLDPTDQLMHICVHGIRYHDEKNIRWIADALTVLRENGQDIRWQELFDKAQKLGLFLPIKKAILHLHRVYKIPLPSSVLDTIAHIPVSKIEEKEFELKGRSLGRLGWIRYSWLKNLRSSDRHGPHSRARRWIQFLRFYQNMWGIDSLWQLPFEKFKRTIRYKFNSQKK